MPNKVQQTRRRKKSPLRKLFGFLLICGLILFGVSVFFRISDIAVEGNTPYTSGQIIEASGLSFGNHLLFIDEAAATENIRRTLPHIGQAQIVRRFPSRIEIWVQEARPVAYVRNLGEYLIIDASARVLEIQQTVAHENLLSLLGVFPYGEQLTGTTLNLEEAYHYQLEYLQEILSAFDRLDLVDQIIQLDMTDVLNPIFDLSGRFTVHLGPNRNLNHKMHMLLEIYASIDPEDRGLIDLNPNNPIFRPMW